MLQLAADLVAVPSVSLDEGELADLVEGQLGQCDHLITERLGHNVVARTEFGHDQRMVVAGHLDTVPENDNLPGRIEGDRLYGLGACDMKATVAVMIALAEELTETALDVTWVFYEAEEIAAVHNGLRRLFAERPDLLECDVAVLGEPTSAMIEAGCQGTLRARVTFEGRRAHTARPWMGTNAIHRLGDLLVRLGQYEARRPSIDGCEYREAIQSVFVEGGSAGNVVPDRAVLTVNHRFAPDRSSDEAVAHLREVVGECDGFEVTDLAAGAPPSVSHPLIASLIERNRLPVNAKLGWTDVARFAEHGIPAVNFGAGDPAHAHTRGEFVDRGDIELVHGALRDLVTKGA
ncbi:MAG: succinyl-diaminopimelate desuccinylase [Actinomycetia bacterium]|nr:succinyl-diaminopimelate desuccinylase [Actinomycetes bacterium]MCP4962582.1 succinyl-diaminopimelate desuccinylase [Actinomycetes bacterium]